MNVNDQWMLEKMQQMAASMASALPQTGQSSEASKTEKGESFKDMMDKAKDTKAEDPKKTDVPAKKEPVQSREPVRQPEKSQMGKNTSTVNMDSNTAALVAAGYAQILEVYEDGSALILMDPEKTAGGFAIVSSGLLTEDQGLVPVTITNAQGEKITITPEQLQEVFDRFGLSGPQKSDKGMTLVGQLNLVEHQNMVIRTLDGQTTTLQEWTEQSDDQDDADLDASMMADQPLFKDVKAAPVKVGENFQLDTQQPEMDDHLADTIRYAAQQGLRQIEIKLSPENLGNLTIKLTQAADGTLQVVLHAANAKAANLLTQHMDGLNQALQGYSQNQEVRVEVQRGEDSQQAQQQQADPDGHNQNQQQQQRQQEQSEHSGDFVQRLRLGLFQSEE